jgi:hypothetical protein
MSKASVTAHVYGMEALRNFSHFGEFGDNDRSIVTPLKSHPEKAHYQESRHCYSDHVRLFPTNGSTSLC